MLQLLLAVCSPGERPAGRGWEEREEFTFPIFPLLLLRPERRLQAQVQPQIHMEELPLARSLPPSSWALRGSPPPHELAPPGPRASPPRRAPSRRAPPLLPAPGRSSPLRPGSPRARPAAGGSGRPGRGSPPPRSASPVSRSLTGPFLRAPWLDMSPAAARARRCLARGSPCLWVREGRRGETGGAGGGDALMESGWALRAAAAAGGGGEARMCPASP